jgi:BirA family biotin operon repressor/biotin-[acetyl-CoA-carboxylase] ligase
MAIKYTITNFETVDSTNKEARRLAERGAGEGTVVTARTQTDGFGRFGRSWSSESGGLYMSLILTPGRTDGLTLLAGLAVVRALESIGVGTRLKWPNDVLYGGRKVCGISAQAFDGYVILGIGVNIANDIPDGLVGKAVSLKDEGVDVDINILTDCILNELNSLYAPFNDGGFALYKDEYIRLNVNINARVTAIKDGAEIRGVAVGLTDSGELTVQLDGGEIINISSGEVTLSEWG